MVAGPQGVTAAGLEGRGQGLVLVVVVVGWGGLLEEEEVRTLPEQLVQVRGVGVGVGMGVGGWERPRHGQW